MHYIFALTRARYIDWANEMRLSMYKHALTVHPYLRKKWLEVAIPIARGLVAYANGEWFLSAYQLKPVIMRSHEIGGSHAQRALFKQIYLDAVSKVEKPRQNLEKALALIH